jgi:hypothetical protein
MSDTPSKQTDQDFLGAAKGKERGLVSEFVDFLAENKLWWMSPILIVLLLVGVLLVLGTTGLVPFIYTLF